MGTGPSPCKTEPIKPISQRVNYTGESSSGPRQTQPITIFLQRFRCFLVQIRFKLWFFQFFSRNSLLENTMGIIVFEITWWCFQAHYHGHQEEGVVYLTPPDTAHNEVSECRAVKGALDVHCHEGWHWRWMEAYRIDQLLPTGTCQRSAKQCWCSSCSLTHITCI